jgi:hypothetical protein
MNRRVGVVAVVDVLSHEVYAVGVPVAVVVFAGEIQAADAVVVQTVTHLHQPWAAQVVVVIAVQAEQGHAVRLAVGTLLAVEAILVRVVTERVGVTVLVVHQRVGVQLTRLAVGAGLGVAWKAIGVVVVTVGPAAGDALDAVVVDIAGAHAEAQRCAARIWRRAHDRRAHDAAHRVCVGVGWRALLDTVAGVTVRTLDIGLTLRARAHVGFAAWVRAAAPPNDHNYKQTKQPRTQSGTTHAGASPSGPSNEPGRAIIVTSPLRDKPKAAASAYTGSTRWSASPSRNPVGHRFETNELPLSSLTTTRPA